FSFFAKPFPMRVTTVQSLDGVHKILNTHHDFRSLPRDSSATSQTYECCSCEPESCYRNKT
ncbi:hypothetical protein L9F63_023473, partial [Diploptera punctata]